MKSKLLWIGIVAAFAASGCSGSGVTPPAPTLGSAPAAGTTSTRAAQDATGVLQDGGFEDGYTYWSQCGTGVSASIQTSVVHGGTHAAKMGGTTTVPNGDAALCQSFTIPSGSPSITFWIQESTDLTSSSGDYQAGELTSASGTVRKNLYKETASTSGWVQRTVDLSSFAGQTVVLKFVVHGNGASGHHIVQYIDDITIGGGGGATPTPAPTATPTSGPTATPGGDPCTQTRKSGQSSAVSIVPYTTFTSTLEAAHSICFSAYVFTTDSFNALDAAAKAGATETVVLPQEESGLDSAKATTLQNDGATIVWDPGSSGGKNPLHAKLAILDGVPFLDGRNWDSTDVVIEDGTTADFTAIENALNLNPTSSTNLDTLKSNSITREKNYINAGSYSSSVTLRYMTESFGTNPDINAALAAAAQSGATVKIIVLTTDESGNTTEQAELTTLKNDGAQVRLNPAGGSEKISLLSNSSSGWFGSANSTKDTTTATNYIDWGMTVTDSTVLSSLSSYFDTTWNSSTAY